MARLAADRCAPMCWPDADFHAGVDLGCEDAPALRRFCDHVEFEYRVAHSVYLGSRLDAPPVAFAGVIVERSDGFAIPAIPMVWIHSVWRGLGLRLYARLARF